MPVSPSQETDSKNPGRAVPAWPLWIVSLGLCGPSSKNLELGPFEDPRVVLFPRVAYCKLSGFLGIATLTSSLPLSPMSSKSVPLSKLAAYEGAV